MVIPTNRPVRRLDLNDQVYKTQREKFKAVVEEIRSAHARKQPVLVGTVAVETSEILSKLLRKENIVHNVLNAKITPGRDCCQCGSAGRRNHCH